MVMNKMTRWLGGIILIFLAIGTLSYFNKTPTDRGIKIGGLFGLTGFVSFTAEDSRDGFLLAIEDYGKPVDYVIEDFHSDIKGVVTAANKLINIDKVSVVIGPEWNEFGEAISTVADNHKIPFISPWAATEKDWVKTPYYFSATPSERSHTRRIIEYMVSNNTKTLAVLMTNNAWSLEHVDIFKDELAKTDISIVEELKFNPEQKDFRTEIIRLKAKNPDALYTPIAAGNQAGPLFKQIAELDLNSQLYAPESVGQDQSVRSQFIDYMDGLIYYIPRKYKNTDEFIDKFENRFGRKPVTRTAATAYDMTTLVLMAVDGGAKTPDNIKDYLLDVKDYDGYSNNIRFNEYGQLATEGVDLIQIKNGKNEPIK